MIKKILFSLVIILLLAPVFVFAQDGPIKSAADNFGDLSAHRIKLILTNVAQWLLVLFGVIAVIVAIWSAYLFLTAGDNEEQLTKAKKTLVWAVVGIVVATLAFSIVVFTESLLRPPTDTGNIQIIKTI